MKQTIGVAGYLILLCLHSCSSSSSDQARSFTSGSSTIIADESFAPIVEDELFVFKKSYPDAEINVKYRPEIQLLNAFLNDSGQVAVMSRRFTVEERKIYENKNIVVRVNRFAVDGIALVTHKTTVDSNIAVDELVDVMKGNKGNIQNLVFDNANSSTVRYLKEISGVKDLPKTGIYALKSNSEVIKFVHNNPGSIGVIGVNWMKGASDKETRTYISNLKTMGVKNSAGKKGSDDYYYPDQNSLALGLYALTRELFIINCEGGPGPGAGFASFIAGERGQRIVLKSGLLPDKIPSREIIIRSKL
jgi:phosphate transport system substrate-binding protein